MKIKLIIAFFFLSVFYIASAQPEKALTQKQTFTDEGYDFTVIFDLKATPVKNQANTGTCWCFATTSFIESELLRMGRGEYDLSEMFIVRYNYVDKLKDNYLRQGRGNLGQGSLSHDWMMIFAKKGIVPEEVYPGLNYGSAIHNHGELNAFINAVASVPVQRKQESPQYHQIVNAILDIYFGKVPETFTYRGVTYTPESFAASLGINPEDYVEITSFTHFPFYTRGIVEVPDNWRMEKFYNVTLDELIEIIDYSLSNGYTIAWDGDVSERGFMHLRGIAIIPENELSETFPPAVRQGFETESVHGRRDVKTRKDWPIPEQNINQEIRQAGFENFSTTDDHMMHITGLVKDRFGKKYYKTKNSWGTGGNPFNGYLYMSENYVKAKTIFIMVHKNGIPPAIRVKLGI